MAGVEPFVIGSARSAYGSFEFPPVVFFGKIENMLGFYAYFFKKFGGFLVSRRSVVALENRGTDFVSVKPENLCQNIIRPLSFFLFEIIAERPVAHHLEKSEVSGIAYAFDIDRSHATLNVAKSCLAGGMFRAEQIRHERLHPRNVEHNARRSVADKRHRADVFMSSFLIKFYPGISELFRSNHCISSRKVTFTFIII